MTIWDTPLTAVLDKIKGGCSNGVGALLQTMHIIEENMKRFVILLPVFAGVLWGSVGIFVRTLSANGLNNQTILSTRFVLAAAVLFIGILLFNRRLLLIRIKDIWLFAAGGLLGVTALNLCYNEAIKHLHLSLAAVLLSLAPVFVVLMAAVIFKERLTPMKFICMALAAAGCVLVSGVLERDLSEAVSGVGVVFGVCSGIAFALYNIFSKLAAKCGYGVFTITFYCMSIAAIIMLPFTDMQTLGCYLSARPLMHSAFLLLHALCTSVLPYVVYTVALAGKSIDAGVASILAAGAEPTSAMVFGLMFFAESPTSFSLIGLVVVIASVALLLRQSNPA